MAKDKHLLLEINKLKMQLRNGALEKEQIAYLRSYLKKHKKRLLLFLFLCAIETIISLLLPVVIKYRFESDFSLLRLSDLQVSLVFFTILVALFLVNSFFILRFGQKTVYTFINTLRRDWFARYLGAIDALNSDISQRNLFVKFVYHTQLLKMGLERTMYDGVRAFFLYIGLLGAAFLFSSTVFLWFCIAFPLLCLLFIGFYFIGRYYVSREQTLNKKIIHFLHNSLENDDFIRLTRAQNSHVQRMTDLLDVDAYFRIRRETWIRFGDRVLFSALLLCAGAYYLLKSYYSIGNFESWGEVAVTGILLAFFTRLIFQVSHTGLFFEAFSLGLKTSVPRFKSYKKNIKTLIPLKVGKEIKIKGRRTKISKYSRIIKNFELIFKVGDKVLVTANGTYGKSTLARFIVGQQLIDSLTVRLGKKFLNAFYWAESKHSRYLITLATNFNGTVSELLSGKIKDDVTREDLDEIYMKLKQYNDFDFIFEHKDYLAKHIQTGNMSSTEFILLQIAHVLLNKYSIVCVDHTAFDLDSDVLKKGWKIINENLNNTALICFSSKPNHSVNFDAKYKLTENSLEEI